MYLLYTLRKWVRNTCVQDQYLRAYVQKSTSLLPGGQQVREYPDFPRHSKGHTSAPKPIPKIGQI